MDRSVDLAGDERGVYLLGEQPLAPGLSERPILDRVAARADDLERNPPDFPSQRLGKPTPRLARLRERERRAARAEREKDGRGHCGDISIEEGGFLQAFPGTVGSRSAVSLACSPARRAPASVKSPYPPTAAPDSCSASRHRFDTSAESSSA